MKELLGLNRFSTQVYIIIGVSRFLEVASLTRSLKAIDTRYLACAHILADKAEAAILPFFREPLSIHNKHLHGGYDPVTAADRAAEQVIADHLAHVFPEHGLEGEEFGHHRHGGPYKWVIDPIDGTRSFIMGSPMWGTLIGLMEEMQPILGVINQPFTKERFWSDGVKSYFSKDRCKEKILSTRNCSEINEALLMTTDPELFREGPERAGFEKVRSKVRMSRYGGDCYAYALLAFGFVDIIIECGLKSYDVIALIPIIHAAGGSITDWKGNPAISGGSIVACGDRKLHEKILQLLE